MRYGGFSQAFLPLVRAHGLPYRAALSELIARRTKKLLKRGGPGGNFRRHSAFYGSGSGRESGPLKGTYVSLGPEPRGVGPFVSSPDPDPGPPPRGEGSSWSSPRQHVMAAAHEAAHGDDSNDRRVAAWLRGFADNGVGAEAAMASPKAARFLGSSHALSPSHQSSFPSPETSALASPPSTFAASAGSSVLELLRMAAAKGLGGVFSALSPSGGPCRLSKNRTGTARAGHSAGTNMACAPPREAVAAVPHSRMPV